MAYLKLTAGLLRSLLLDGEEDPLQVAESIIYQSRETTEFNGMEIPVPLLSWFKSETKSKMVLTCFDNPPQSVCSIIPQIKRENGFKRNGYRFVFTRLSDGKQFKSDFYRSLTTIKEDIVFLLTYLTNQSDENVNHMATLIVDNFNNAQNQ